MTIKSDEKSKKYSAIKTRIFLTDLVLTVCLLVIFQVFLSRRVSVLAHNSGIGFYAGCFVFVAAFMLFLYVMSLPLHVYSSFILEHKFGLSRQSLSSWFRDEAKSAGLSFVLAVFCVETFYALLRNFSSAWWIIAAAAWIFFLIILAKFFPVFIIPLFYKYLPMEDNEYKKKVIDTAERAGVKLMDVCRIDFSRKTSKANAALVGLGRTRRVILADTLVEKFSPEEVEVVAAHEFGHFKFGHMRKLLFFSGLTTIAGFFLLSRLMGEIVHFFGSSEIYDLYLLPILVFMMMLFGVFLMPIQNFFSRVLEREADSFSLKLTSNPEAFISAMEKLAFINLAETDPSFLKKVFLYNHPPIRERIEMAKNVRAEKNERYEKTSKNSSSK
ncbi:MAG: M48 family metallopeptidase [Candidatus Omnitrophota bacterium]